MVCCGSPQHNEFETVAPYIAGTTGVKKVWVVPLEEIIVLGYMKCDVT